MRPTLLHRSDKKLSSWAGGLVPMMVAATSLLLPAQVVGGSVQGTHGPFAPPWGVTFAKVKDAMGSGLGGLVVRQTRRLRTVDRNTGNVSYPGTLESLKYRPGANGGPFRFTLDFQGVEGNSGV